MYLWLLYLIEVSGLGFFPSDVVGILIRTTLSVVKDASHFTDERAESKEAFAHNEEVASSASQHREFEPLAMSEIQSENVKEIPGGLQLATFNSHRTVFPALLTASNPLLQDVSTRKVSMTCRMLKEAHHD